MDDRFARLVVFLATWAWQLLGKIPHPVTKKVERDLEAAKGIIGLLEMLEEKTRGSLDDEEARMLENTLADLRLNYVEESAKPEPGAEGGNGGEKPEEPAPGGDEAPQEPA